jgi:hypothetical protein
MRSKLPEDPVPLFQLELGERGKPLPRWRLVVGIASVLLAAFFLLWILLGTLSGLASPLEVFGVFGLRIASAVVAGGLLLASIVFADF